jgi:hypothetical protein
MSLRELILLSPYRVPAQNPLMLGNEETAAFLNAYSALWHPALLEGAAGPPRIGSPYDFEQPTEGQVYALPESPPLILPDDWDERVHRVGALAFRANSDRAATFAHLIDAIRSGPGGNGASGLLELRPEQVGPFLGIGFGYRMLESLFEAMEHENVLAPGDFWHDVQQAVANLKDPEPEAFRRPLQAAADRLLAAREVLYPVKIHLIDLCLLDELRLGASLPASLEKGLPLNVVAAAHLLERLGQEQPEHLDRLRERANARLAEVCGGCYLEREDALLPIESQLWNLRKGLAVSQELLGQEVQVFARKRFAAHPQLPLLLQSVGLRRAVLLAFDEAVLPTYRVTVVNWPSPDGKQVEAFTRAPYKADSPQTFFHWGHYLHQTIAQDHAATLALLHTGEPACPWYEDLLELSRFGPVLGQWTTLSRYFDDVLAGEYTSAGTPDDFHGDYLSERTNAHLEHPVSWFAEQVRERRRLDSAWALAALQRGLAGRNDPLRWATRLAEVEDRFEANCPGAAAEVAEVERETATALADRLLSRATNGQPGYLVLNPCSFARRLALELKAVTGPVPIAGPLKACQVDSDLARFVVEVPALGFAWFPRSGPPGTLPQPARMRLADGKAVRNEFFEAEIDTATGGLRGLRDHRTRINRIGQQLVFNPGSTMHVQEITVTSAGPALGEVVSQGLILDEHQQTLATFRQRFRAWLGRPVLDLRIEIVPHRPPQGYPWHAYYGARFAWRDERAALLRGVNGTAFTTSHTRPETPDYLELRLSRQSTTLFPCGLPFHQRNGGRMLDLILIPEGETAQAFDVSLGLDRDYPMQTALGLVTPPTIVPTEKGPPHIGAAGWLFHLDAPNLLLTGLRPAADGTDAITIRMLESSQQHGQAELRCARNPQRALLRDAQGELVHEAGTSGDAVHFEAPAGDLIELHVEFS